jgi:hypothetical protein
VVDIPFLSEYPFEFDQFVNEGALSYSANDRTRWITVTPTHLPVESKVNDAHVIARVKFVGGNINDDLAKRQAKELLDNHLHHFKKLCNEFLIRYFVILTKHLSIFYDGDKKCENWSHIVASFCQCQNREDVEKFLVLLYISFDFVENSRDQLAAAVLRQIGLRVVKTDVKHNRKKINCFQRIASRVLSELRKSLNRMGPKTCGWTITNIRPGFVLDLEEIDESGYRMHKHIYPWMINGEKVE